jgi:hypothetical protein
MQADPTTTSASTHTAHEYVGAFLVHCSLLEYRASQFVARWFCSEQKQKFLGYTLHGMRLAELRQIIEERLTPYHGTPGEVRETMAEIARVIERRDLVAKGLLTKDVDGDFCIKSFCGLRFLSGPGEIDIIKVSALPEWTDRAKTLAERVVALGQDLRPG